MTLINSVFKPTHALWWYVASILVMSFGLFMSAQNYPGGFDWFYTVASGLASQRHNPDGYIWFAVSLSLSMSLLWIYISLIKVELTAILPAPELAITVLRIGLVSGFLLGAERLFIYDMSNWLYKSHEILALFTFLSLYLGLLVLLLKLLRRSKNNIFPALLFVSPLVVIGLTQLWIYLAQYETGWVDTVWREKGIPVWLSFAFWQWLAIGIIWVGLGLLHIFSNKNKR